MLCFRLFSENNPAVPLADAVAQLREGQAPKDLYAVEPASFQQIPNAPFAYWVSERIRRLFVELPAFEGEGRTVRQGIATADDFRFARLSWETPVHEMRSWLPFAKGGSYSPYYADVPLRVNWAGNGRELDAFAGSVLRNIEFNFRSGLVFPRRTRRFCPRVLTRGSLFSNSGQVAFAPGREMPLLALLFSNPTQALIRCSLGVSPSESGGNPQYEVGTVQSLPISNNVRRDEELKIHVAKAWSSKRHTDNANLVSNTFFSPALVPRRS